MNTRRSISYFLAVGVLGLLLSLTLSLGSCAMISGRETAGEYIDDATITTKVKARILDDPNLKVLQINVETMKGVVQLSGFVDSYQTRQRAVALTRQVKGVVSVKDNMLVR